jgi:hypothetical protein
MISFIAVICLVLPLFCVQVAAAVEFDVGDYSDNLILQDEINAALGLNENVTVEIIGSNDTTLSDDLAIYFRAAGQSVIWSAYAPDINLFIGGTGLDDPTDSTSFTMDGGVTNYVLFDSGVVDSNTVVTFLNEADAIDTVNGFNLDVAGITAYYDETINTDLFKGAGSFLPYVPPANDPPPENELPIVVLKKTDRKIGDEFTLYDITDDKDRLTVVITDNEPFIKDGIEYAGIVDIKNFYTDDPEEIPKEVIIDGLRYLMGDTIYIVAVKNLELIGYSETGISYVFPAVENSDNAATFSAIGLPRGVTLSKDGVLSTEELPLRVGIYGFKITVDNGIDKHTIEVKLNIKAGYASDDELAADLTKNDKEAQPEVMDDADESDGDEGGGVLNLWLNGVLKLHYDPDMEDFEGLFLDGKLLIEDEDYTVEDGSTVIILTEQTMAPLPTGDHVVTTMFHQDSDVGMDTVINDVGSSSFVFRFGDGKTTGKRVNIGGDGVMGSVTFDDKESEEAPITTISANTEAIEERANNLSNATGKEIIAAFETKQTGGFGGKTATFAVSVKSLNLTLKNGTAVYIAVYDAKTGKTYQNKGEVRDGMIVFKTKHSGVFMISLEKF